MRARWLWGGVSLCVAVAAVGCGELDTADRVHDLRLLAMRADPPEQVLPVAFLPDGGVVPVVGGGRDGGTGGLPRVPAIAPVTVTALMADPAGNGRDVSYRFSTCAQLTSDTHRCEQDSPAYQVLAEGILTPTDVGGEPQVTFTPDYTLLGQVVSRDPYRGLGGVQLPVQIELSAGDESVVGYKRVTFTLGQALQPPNTNPVIQSLLYNDADWAPDQQLEFVSTLRATRGPGGFRPPGGEADGGTTGQNRITPVVDPSQVEEYDRPTLDNSGTVHFTEQWRYNFFATQGTFSSASTGGGNIVTGADSSTASNWTVLRDEPGGSMTLWVVVRDGRGGESWISRKAIAPVGPAAGR